MRRVCVVSLKMTAVVCSCCFHLEPRMVVYILGARSPLLGLMAQLLSALAQLVLVHHRLAL